MVWPEAFQAFGVDLFDALNGRLCPRRAWLMVQHLMRTPGTATCASVSLEDTSTYQWDIKTQLLLAIRNALSGGPSDDIPNPVSEALEAKRSASRDSSAWTAEDLVRNIRAIPETVLLAGVTRQ